METIADPLEKRPKVWIICRSVMRLGISIRLDFLFKQDLLNAARRSISGDWVRILVPSSDSYRVPRNNAKVSFRSIQKSIEILSKIILK